MEKRDLTKIAKTYEIDGQFYRECNTCKAPKHITCFAKDTGKHRYRKYQCKVCQAKAEKARRQNEARPVPAPVYAPDYQI